ncbi:MAG: TrmH family RNA methyltransferase [Syntrophomonadales bacterium]|jgi:TrmH family RNA methyltransferase
MHKNESETKQSQLNIKSKLITSRDNPVFKLAKTLGSRKGREKTGRFIVEGFKLVSEALLHPELVETILISETSSEVVSGNLTPRSVPMTVISSELALRLSETETTQGIWAICKRPDWGQLESADSIGFVLVLAGIQDPGNLGTILRTAWAVGVEAVLLSVGSVDPFNPKIVRSAMGATLNLPTFTSVTLSDVRKLKEKGFRVIACDPQGEASLFESHLKDKLIIIMGNEGQGLSAEWKAVADSRLNIPLQPGVDSLNVAVASGIVLYEAYRQRHGL